MLEARKFGWLVLVFGLVLAISAEAQPPQGQRRGGGGGGRGGGGAAQIQRFLPLEASLGFLAFDEKVGLDNEQLLKVVSELRALYTKRQEIAQSMQGGGDRQAAMQDVQGLRQELTQKLGDILKPDQLEAFRGYMQQMQQRQGGGRGGEGRGGQGGGRRGGQGGGRRGGQGGGA